MKIRFGQHVRFSEDRFGAEDKGREYYDRTWRGALIGFTVHKTFGVYEIAGVKQYDKAVIFYRVFGVQHKVPFLEVYPGGAPSSGAGGDKLKAARVIYKTFTAEQKAAYDLEARKQMLTDGFNIYLREYNEANP